MQSNFPSSILLILSDSVHDGLYFILEFSFTFLVLEYDIPN